MSRDPVERSGGRRRPRRVAVVAVFLVASTVAGLAVAQRYGGRRGGYRPPAPVVAGTGVTEIVDRNGVADWPVDPAFKHDLFTFVRVRYSSGGGGGYRGGGRWQTDYPDSDLNFSFRLQQVTSLKVDPRPKQLDLTDPALFDYPFVYIVEPGALSFDEAEVVALRRYLLNGGFLMVDDFWGEDEWVNFRDEMKRVFPDRDAVELPLEHPVFHCVFDLKEKPQTPSIENALRHRGTNVTWERDGYDPTTQEVHYKGLFDDKGRMMAIICHNTDNGDGWEREGENEYYFREFSEKKAFPMGINIVYYAMTH